MQGAARDGGRGRRGGLLAAVLFAAALGGGCQPQEREGVITLDAARLHLGDAETPPDPSLPGWTARRLPDLWTLERRREALRGWYRLGFDLPALPTALWSVYVPRVSTNAAVYVNGVFVGSGGSFEEPLARNANRPLLFRFTPVLLQEGHNEIAVRLAVRPTIAGGLAPLQVGPYAVLRPDYERRYFLQVTLEQWSWILLVAAGLLLLGIHLKRPRPTVYGWLSATSFALATFISAQWVQEPPIPEQLWEWMSASSLFAFVTFAAITIHRVQGVRPRALEGLFFGQLLLGTALLLVVEPLAFSPVALLWTGFALLIAGYLIVRLLIGAPGGARRPLVVVPALLALAFGLADLAGLVGLRPITALPLFPLVPPLVVLPLFWLMIRRFVEAMNEAEDLNRELEARVASKGVELERNHARLRDLERRSLLAAERERLMRDVHDGLGSQLVAALGLAEGQGSRERIAATLRDALDDLRLVIDSLEPVEEDLPAVLGMLRARLESRLERQGVRFEWEVTELPSLPGLGPPGALHALRIVQEAISNALRHARAKTIRVRTGEAPDDDGRPGVFVEVADDGIGMAPRSASGGRGLGNMARRAADLGGRLSIVSGPSGTTVLLWIPRDGAPGLA